MATLITTHTAYKRIIGAIENSVVTEQDALLSGILTMLRNEVRDIETNRAEELEASRKEQEASKRRHPARAFLSAEELEASLV